MSMCEIDRHECERDRDRDISVREIEDMSVR